MNVEERTEITDAFFETCQGILSAKSEDYSHDGTAFQDFETIAVLMQRLGFQIDRETVCLILKLKHLVGISRWVRDKGQTAQSIEERFADDVNYTAIMHAMSIDLETPKPEDEEKAKLRATCASLQETIVKLNDRINGKL